MLQGDRQGLNVHADQPGGGVLVIPAVRALDNASPQAQVPT